MSLESVLVAKGLETGVLAFDKAKELMKESWRRTGFFEFDIEKVFWQTIYIEGLYLLGKFTWNIVYWLGSVGLVEPIIHQCQAMPFTWPPIWECKKCKRWFGSSEECEEYHAGLSEEEAPTMLFDKVMDAAFTTYFPYIALSIPIFLMLLELKNVKRKRRMEKW